MKSIFSLSPSSFSQQSCKSEGLNGVAESPNGHFSILKAKHQNYCRVMTNLINDLNDPKMSEVIQKQISLMAKEFETDVKAVEAFVFRGQGRMNTTNKCLDSKLEPGTLQESQQHQDQCSNFNLENRLCKIEEMTGRLLKQKAISFDPHFQENKISEGLDSLYEELEWIDQNTVKARIECEKRILSAVKTLEDRISLAEQRLKEQNKYVNVLVHRIEKMEKAAIFSTDQIWLVQDLSDRVKCAVESIQRKLQENSVSANKSELQMEAIKSIVQLSTENLRSELLNRIEGKTSGERLQRKIKLSKLEQNLSRLIKRVTILENRVTEDHETSIRTLEKILQASSRSSVRSKWSKTRAEDNIQNDLCVENPELELKQERYSRNIPTMQSECQSRSTVRPHKNRRSKAR